MRDFSFSNYDEQEEDIERVIARRKRKIHKQQLFYSAILAVILFIICIWVYRKSVYVYFDGYVSVDSYTYRSDDDIFYLGSDWLVGDMILPGDTVFSYVLAENFFKEGNRESEPSVIVHNRDLGTQYGMARQDLSVLSVRISELERQLSVESHNIKLGLSNNRNQLRTEQELAEAKEQYNALRRKLGVLWNSYSKTNNAVRHFNNNGYGFLTIDDMRDIPLLDSLGYVHHSIAVDTFIVTNKLVPTFSLVLRGEPIMTAQGLNLKDNNMSIVAYVMPNQMKYINYHTQATVIVTDEITYSASVMMLGARTEKIPGELHSSLSRDHTASIVEFGVDQDQVIPFWSLVNKLPVTIRINKMTEAWSKTDDYIVFNTTTGIEESSVKRWKENKVVMQEVHHAKDSIEGDDNINLIPVNAAPQVNSKNEKATSQKKEVEVKPVAKEPTKVEEPTKSADATKATKQLATKAVNKPKNYHVVVGSTIDKNYAQRQLVMLRNKGYEDASLIYGNDRYRIVALSFSTLDEANKATEEFRQKEGNNSAWVLHQSAHK